jgi:hypothetical protein
VNMLNPMKKLEDARRVALARALMGYSCTSVAVSSLHVSSTVLPGQDCEHKLRPPAADA